MVVGVRVFVVEACEAVIQGFRSFLMPESALVEELSGDVEDGVVVVNCVIVVRDVVVSAVDGIDE